MLEEINISIVNVNLTKVILTEEKKVNNSDIRWVLKYKAQSIINL